MQEKKCEPHCLNEELCKQVKGGLGDGRRAKRRPMGAHHPATAPAQTAGPTSG
jgi:hypothetical protein